MFPKTSPATDGAPKSEAQRDEKRPNRSFSDVMAARELPSMPTRRSTVFDLASKDSKRAKPEKKQKKREAESAPIVVVQERAVATPLKTEMLSPLEGVKGLPLEMQVLVDKMADFVQIESHNGISTTTVSLGMEGGSSLFKGSEIQIDHYDSAPHSFNIQLSGTPEAVDLFTQHLASLQAALQERLENYQILLLTPILKPFEVRKRERKRQMGTKKSERGKLKDARHSNEYALFSP
ncbi:MAG: hypothetical protein K1060chlam2_01427 [Chlamydiae bacterium]|nr:hypothetical protein [Chlamydiota bacterium]